MPRILVVRSGGMPPWYGRPGGPSTNSIDTQSDRDAETDDTRKQSPSEFSLFLCVMIFLGVPIKRGDAQVEGDLGIAHVAAS